MTDSHDMTGEGPGRRRLVTFRVESRLFAVEVGHVLEIKGWRPATPIPHAPRHVLGVINLRGAILAVHDLGARIGLGLTRATAAHVILVLQAGGRTVGLLVDAVCDIVDVPDAAIAALPDLASRDPLCAGVVTLGDSLIALLSLERALALGPDAARAPSPPETSP